jgi:hypothetical protein
MLRGANSPAVSLLEAIKRINPNFRVSFTPAVEHDGHITRPALWWIHEQKSGTRADYLRREAGRYRLGRLWKRPRKELERRIASWWEAEYMAAGLYLIRSYERAEWGEQAMLEQLRQGEAMYQLELKKAARAATQDDLAAAQAEDEMYDNPEFAGFVRDVAFEFYRNVSGGALEQVTATLTKEPSDDRTHGEPMGRPGHGEDCEPRQHPDGPAGPRPEDQVRSVGDGSGQRAAGDGDATDSTPGG